MRENVRHSTRHSAGERASEKERERAGESERERASEKESERECERERNRERARERARAKARMPSSTCLSRDSRGQAFTRCGNNYNSQYLSVLRCILQPLLNCQIIFIKNESVTVCA